MKTDKKRSKKFQIEILDVLAVSQALMILGIIVRYLILPAYGI